MSPHETLYSVHLCSQEQIPAWSLSHTSLCQVSAPTSYLLYETEIAGFLVMRGRKSETGTAACYLCRAPGSHASVTFNKLKLCLKLALPSLEGHSQSDGEMEPMIFWFLCWGPLIMPIYICWEYCEVLEKSMTEKFRWEITMWHNIRFEKVDIQAHKFTHIIDIKLRSASF